MGDADAIRPTGAQRPPFPGGIPPPRPMAGPPRPAMPPNLAGNPMRHMPPPIRTDSRGNLLMGPGPGQRPLGPPMPQQQQMRPPSSGGPLSPPGQGPPTRPNYPWSGPPGQQAPTNRPHVGNPPTRPPFARPPNANTPAGQPPQFRPPFQQQLSQQQMYLPQQQQLHQPKQQQPLQQPPQGPPSSAGSNNNEDDDDVIMGQAVTPLKSLNLKEHPMGSSLLEETDLSYGMPTTRTTTKIDDLMLPTTTTTEINHNSAKISNFEDHNATTNNGYDKTYNKSNEKDLYGNAKGDSTKKSTFIKGDNDSGVDESTQEKERNGPVSPSSPVKTPTSTSSKVDKTGASRPPSATSNISNKSRSTSRNRLSLKTPEPESVKKVPMNKIQVGHAPSPNLKAVRSKIGSLDNTTYKPGGGHVKIETKKIEIKAAPRIEAKNEKYAPKGGEKKIVTTKLQWNAKSKIGSLENAHHKPGGGDKKIETIKTEFKDKAKPKIGSKDNVKHIPGGGDIKIQTQKIEVKAQSKIGSLDNIKHKPGGGERKIFDDKDYLKNVEHSVALTPPSQSPQPSMTTSISGADEHLNQQS